MTDRLPPVSGRGDGAAARTKIGSDQESVPKGLGAASAAPAPANPPYWRWYLGLGLFIGYAAGALTIGGFWWWGW